MGKLGLRCLVISLVVGLCAIGCRRAVHSATASGDGIVPDLGQVEWLVLGPFDNPSGGLWSACQGFDRDFLKELGGESKALPRKGLQTASRSWIATRLEGERIEFHQLYPSVPYSVFYAYCEFLSPSQQTVVLKLGTCDGVKVWCNGQLLWSEHLHRNLRPDQDAVRLPLQAGASHLLIKSEWSIAPRLCSVQDEQRVWEGIPSPGFRVCVPSPAVLSSSDLARCVPVTAPALGVREQVELTVRDVRGKVLARQTAWTGEMTQMSLPPGFSGAYLVQAVGIGAHAGIKSRAAAGLVGEPKPIAEDVTAYARQIAGRLPANGGEDVAATLAFLADQLDGKHPQDLSTLERNLCAIQTIGELGLAGQSGPWRTGTLHGLCQWAYHSPIDDSLQPYTVYLPDGYDPQKKYGLILTLHGGSGNDHRAAATLGDLRPDDFLLVSPYGRGNVGYRLIGEQDVLDVLERVERTYSVDPDRVYVHGGSMGGYGAWRFGQLFTDRFAAMASFCGMTGLTYLGNLSNLPTLIVHGDADPSVPVKLSRDAAARLKEFGYPVRYDELSGVDHGAWSAWALRYGGDSLFEYFRRYRRNPWPDRVDLTAAHLRYGRQYWVRIEELANPPVPGHVGAEIAGPRMIRVETKQVTALRLDLRHPKLARDGQIALEVDGAQLPVKAGQVSVLLTKTEGRGWSIDAAETLRTMVRHDGGGITDLFYGPLIIVYGTGVAGRAGILRELASRLADWSPSADLPIGCGLGRLRVKADKDLTEAETRGNNLLLIGDPVENLITARMADRLPVHIRDKDLEVAGRKFSGAGLLLTYPNPDAPERLIGVVTLPFADDAIRRYAAIATKLLRTYGYTIGSTIAPDVEVLASPEELERGQPSWMGWFDRRWQQLRPNQSLK